MFSILILSSSILVGCGKNDESAPAEQQVYLSGRIDKSDENSPVIIWQGTQIEFSVRGADYVDLLFSRKSGQVYFNLYIGDKLELFIPEQGANRIELPDSVTATHIKLIKRNEASSGSIAFDGIDLPKGGRTNDIPDTGDRLKFLFFGDSITAGACNEDGSEDQWEDMSTHNALRSYAALTAENFSAEYQNISVSGMGISVGYTESKFPETWNKLYPYGDSIVADLSEFQPDFVFINLGENDDSWSTNRGTQFPLDYINRYIAMVKAMRKAYPDAHFVILRGGMYGGKKSQRLIEPWKKVVESLEEQDSNLSHYVFRHWSSLHPRVKDHERMAAELSAWLEKRIQ